MSIFSTVQGFFVNASVPQFQASSPVVGYLGTDVTEEYIVTILSAQSNPNKGGPIVVRAILQDEVSIRVGSRWESIIQMIRGNNIGDFLEVTAQAAFNVSLQNTVTSRRIWRGTDPLSLTLNLRFEEEYESRTEVMEACEALQCMVLPGENSATFLIPPGPSPFINDVEKIGPSAELISVYVGGVLSFVNVVVKSVDVSYQVRMGTDGFFKAAKVSITFETYEIITKNRLRSSSTNPGIYSSLGVGNKSRYDSRYETQNRAAGFNPNVDSTVADTTTNLVNKVKTVFGQ